MNLGHLRVPLFCFAFQLAVTNYLHNCDLILGYKKSTRKNILFGVVFPSFHMINRNASRRLLLSSEHDYERTR